MNWELQVLIDSQILIIKYLEQVNFIKKNKMIKKENIYSDIDEMLNSTLNKDELIENNFLFKIDNKDI